MAMRRVRLELKEVVTGELYPIRIAPFISGDYFNLRGEITGPSDTPYEGGTFTLDIVIPNSYPFAPPKVKFVTKMWHPNICSLTGAICLNIVEGTWSPGVTLRGILLSLQALLASPEIDHPVDEVVARQFNEDHETFTKTAQHWTAIYAGGPHYNNEYEMLTREIVEMDIDQDDARFILAAHNWDLNLTIDNFHGCNTSGPTLQQSGEVSLAEGPPS